MKIDRLTPRPPQRESDGNLLRRFAVPAIGIMVGVIAYGIANHFLGLDEVGSLIIAGIGTIPGTIAADILLPR